MKKDILSWNEVKKKYLEFHKIDSFTENMAIDVDFGYWLVNNCIIHDVMPRCCSNCRYWRDKGWDGKGNGTGICDNKKVIEQVTMLNEEFLKRFVKGESENDIKYNARWIHNSLRFSDKFRCCHYKLLKH